jgi:hypothetical protein
MAQYWYKKDKRIKRVSNDISKDEIKSLELDGYIQVSDRSNPEGSIIIKNKPKAKIKPKTKKKTKKK